MAEQLFRIVTRGQIAVGFDRVSVEANLARLCKYSPERIARALSGQPFVFKSGLDRGAASCYLQVLSKAGIVCQAEPLPTPIPAQAASTRKAVTCPVCNTVQGPATLCVQCRSVIEPGAQAVDNRPQDGHIRTGGSSAGKWVLVIGVILAVIMLLSYGMARLQLYAQTVIKQGVEARAANGGNSFTEVPPPEQPPVEGSMPKLSNAEIARLRQLLAERDFTALNAALAAFQQEYEQNPALDYRICQAFGLFYGSDPGQRAVLDHWVAATPRHYAPYLARGGYFTSMGWDARGSRWASETSDDQFRAMHDYFDLALADLARALELKPQLLPAYVWKVNISKTHGSDQDQRAVEQQARELFPSSYQLYRKLIDSNLPRWGGSYEQMTQLAIEVNRYAADNPELSFLYGKTYMDQGWYANRDKNYQQAVDLYTRALAYGEYAELLDARGQAFEKYNAPLLAIIDYKRAIELDPTVTDASYHLATELFRQAEYQQALEVVQKAQPYAKPRHKDLLAWYKWTLKILPNKDPSAYAAYLTAANNYVAAKKIIGFPLPREFPTAKTQYRFSAPKGSQPHGLTWFNGQLYLSSRRSMAGVYRYNPENGIAQDLFKPADVYNNQYGGLTTDGERLFHLQAVKGSYLQLLDAKTHAATRQQFLYASQFNYSDLALHDGYLYAIGCHQLDNTKDYRLLKFSLDGTLRDSFDISAYKGVMFNPGLASDGRNLWLALGNTLLKFDPESSSIKEVLDVRSLLSGLAWDGQQLWGVTWEGEVITIAVK